MLHLCVESLLLPRMMMASLKNGDKKRLMIESTRKNCERIRLARPGAAALLTVNN